MRVGTYIDGFNLYYGGRSLMGGPGRPGWRWLDLRKLSGDLVARQSGWPGASVSRVVYCTARISGTPGSTAQHDQDVYLRALKGGGAIDLCEEGVYVHRVAVAPLATKTNKGKPLLVKPQWPVMMQDDSGAHIADGRFMVSVARREEKGSDVNVATHLLIDVFEGEIDAAIVISNDSDLALPIQYARQHVPVGVVNPTTRHRAGALGGTPNDGVGGHWWYRLTPADLTSAQLPITIGKHTRPAGW